MNEAPVLIAGGGIGGLATALTLHQIGVPCRVFESVANMRPLGVGINLQPNAVRELYDLGIADAALAEVGIRCREWALVGLNGNDIYSERRGLDAGYRWPQYSIHRGELHMLLYRTALQRLGDGAICSGHRVVGYRNVADGVVVLVQHDGGEIEEVKGSLLVGADGIHSAVRAQMYPDQPPIHWGGALMWRGTCPGIPVRTGASFVGLGTHRHRVVLYPISPPDPATGLATINWIAEITMDSADGWQKSDWTNQASVDDVVPHFEDWDFGWLNVPDMVRSTADIYEIPMIDRDPVPSWHDGNVVLLGDAAHPMYPTGSHGGTQAIVDARVLGRSILEYGVSAQALAHYDARLCDAVSAVVLRNRGAGPFGLLNIVDERCGGTFEDINTVFEPGEMEAFMERYKQSAGLAMESLNAAERTVPEGARVAGA